MTWALRGAFYLQALLGLGLLRLLMGQAPSDMERNAHLALGAIAAVLALLVLQPTTGSDTFERVAQFFPLVPLLLGLSFRLAILPDLSTVYVHVVAGAIAIGLVETALARRKRRLRESTPAG